MKSILILLISLAQISYAQGTFATTTPSESTFTKTEATDSSPCSLLTEEYLTAKFPGAINFKNSTKEKPYPSCTYNFDVEGSHYFIGLTMTGKYGSEKNLDRVVQSYSDKQLLEGIGQKAYFIPKMGQVSLWEGNQLIHVFVQLDNTGDKDKAIEIAKEILAQL